MIASYPDRCAVAPGELLVDVLGAGSGYPTATRDTTSLLVGCAEGFTLVDCPGAVVHKLARRNLSPADLRRVILTHNHVDHVYGLPHLLQALRLAGADDDLEVAAPAQTLQTVRAMVDLHGLRGGGYPPLREIEIALDEGFELDLEGSMRVRFAPARHGRDTVSVRFDDGAAAVCHSSDTSPCAELQRLAAGAGLLFHDCGGPHRLRADFVDRHSSAREAGEVAAAAGVHSLVLLHLGVRQEELVEECMREAAAAFGGPTVAATDGATWILPRVESADG